MCLEKMVFEVPSLTSPGNKMPSASKRAMWIVVVQCATNTRKIRSGEVLYLSLMDDSGEDSQSEKDECEMDD